MRNLFELRHAINSLIIACFLLFGCSKDQSNQSRIISKLTLIDSVALDSPLLRFQFSDKNLYGYDYYEKSIIRLDKDFSVLSKLGSWGDGPKENLLVRNYEILEDEKIAIFDVEKNTFKIQDFNDSVYLYKKFDYNILNGAYLDSVVIVSKFSEKNSIGFDLFNLNNFEYTPIDPLNKLFNEDYSGLIYEGNLTHVGNKIYFTSYFSSFWFIYDVISKDLQSGSYLQNLKNPKVFDNGSIMMLENATEIIYDSFFSDDLIYIISNVGEKDYSDQRFLDIYDINNFEYIKSYPLPNINETTPDEGFYMGSDKVGILYEDKIFIFKY